MTKIDEEFLKFYEGMGFALNNDYITIKILSHLYLESEPISLEELAKKTGYSLASISNKIKIFERDHLIKRIKKPGCKKVFVYMEKDFFKIMKEHLLTQEKYVVNYTISNLPKLLKKFDKNKLDLEEKKKYKIIEDYNKQIIKMDKLIKQIKVLLQEY